MKKGDSLPRHVALRSCLLLLREERGGGGRTTLPPRVGVKGNGKKREASVP